MVLILTQYSRFVRLCFARLRLHGFIALGCSCISLPLMAATQITAEQLVNNAYADGAMIATANVCHIDKAQLNQLIFQQKKSALDTAKQYQLPFLAKDYDDYVISGFESTMRMLGEQSDDSVLEQICAGLEEKIAKKIAP